MRVRPNWNCVDRVLIPPRIGLLTIVTFSVADQRAVSRSIFAGARILIPVADYMTLMVHMADGLI